MTTLAPVSVALKFGFVAVIYLFALWVVRSARRDLRGGRRRAPLGDDGAGGAPPPDATGLHSASALRPIGLANRAPRLVVERAPGHDAGMIYDLDADMVLGRGDQAEIRLEDPFASARHARVFEQGNIVVIEDLGSTNGTYLNEELLESPRPLHPGDRVRIGDSEFAFEVDLMLRVAEQYAATDTGRQRRANEDSLLSRSPLFVVADGMGGAQAGEVASQLAVEAFKGGLHDASAPEEALARLAQDANTRIHERSHSHTEQAGMGTTLTALYVGPEDVAIAHVGDSRAYCWRDGELIRLTEDHSLVDELMRQGRLTPEEAEEHPQRSVITRALGPELDVEVDTRSFRARAGDVYLLCSDGLTTMVSENDVATVLRDHADLRGAGEALIAAANGAGGRDNITVVLLRIEEVPAPTGTADAAAPGADGSQTRATGSGGRRAGARIATSNALAAAAARPRHADAGSSELEDTVVRAPAPQRPVARRRPRRPSPPARGRAKWPRVRHAGALLAALVILGIVGGGAYVALTSVYFIGTNTRGLVTLYRGVPFKLPGNIALYSSDFVSGVSASTVAPPRRHALLDHSLRSEGNAAALIRSLELGQLE